jgi:hypothetical protein
MDNVEEAAGHTPLEMVHARILTPGARPFTTAEALADAFTVPVPEITSHAAVPDDGVLAESEAEFEQTV